MYFFTLVYARACISMSQLKTAWPNTFFGRFTQHSLAQSSGEKISGVLKFFQYAPSGGWVYLARLFHFWGAPILTTSAASSILIEKLISFII